MKRYNNIKRALWLWSALLMLSIQVNAQQECGTKFNSQQETNNWLLRHQQYEIAQANKLLSPTTIYKWIPVAFHIVRMSNGTGGLSLSDARLALERCNTAYANTNIRFYECNSEFINVDSLYDFNDATEEAALVSSRLLVDAANVFIVNSIPAACGYANFPGATHPGYANNFIVMDFHCMNNASQTSLQHEFGHFFDVVHTHETAFGAELVTRSTGANCSTAGDRFCDTPADPGLGNLVNASCQYTGTATDANGVAYTPDTSNIMSYSHKPCRVNWSQEQINKMNFTVSDLGSADRKNLSCTNCLQAAVTSLPENLGGIYILGEFYTYGPYSTGKKVLSQITSNVNLNTAVIAGSDLKLIATTSITFLPGFNFDAATAQLGELTAIADACGGAGNKTAAPEGTQQVALPGQHAAPEYTLYPNPFNNTFNLDIHLTEDAAVSVTVYDIVGKVVDKVLQPQLKQKGLLQLQYNGERLAPDIYFCTIEINGQRYTKKIIKM
ncbi:MAG: zinc-dependent metalloprotease [Bacteroidia bacterium]